MGLAKQPSAASAASAAGAAGAAVGEDAAAAFLGGDESADAAAAAAADASASAADAARTNLVANELGNKVASSSAAEGSTALGAVNGTIVTVNASEMAALLRRATTLVSAPVEPTMSTNHSLSGGMAVADSFYTKVAVLSQSELFHTRTGVTISVPPGLTCVALQATVTPAWCLSTCAVTTTWIPECPGKCKCEDKGLPPPPGLAGPALGEASLVRPSMQPTDIGRYVGAPPTHATPAAEMASRDFAAGLRLDASAAGSSREQPRSMTPGVMDMGSSAAREQEHYVRIHKFNFTELAMRRLAADKLSKRAAQTEGGLERNNAAGSGQGSGHSKKLLAKKLLVSGKKMQAQKQLRIARSAKGERASTSSEHLRMGSSGGAPGGGLTKQGLAKIEADAKRAGLKAGFKAGMAATIKKAATAHKVKMARGEVSAAKKNLAVGNSKKLVSKSHLLHPKTAKALKEQQYANSKKFAVKQQVQQELEAAALGEVAKAQNSMGFNKKRKLKGQKVKSKKVLQQQVLTKKLGAAKKRNSIDIGLQKDEFKALLMAQTEAYSKRPGVTSLVAAEQKVAGPAALNPNTGQKHSELWLAKHANQDSVGGFKAAGHQAGDKKMSAEDAVAKNLAVAKTQAEAATDTPEELATLAPQVAEQAAAPAAIAAAVAAGAGLAPAAAASKSKFDCVSLSPTATDNWCLTTCGVSMTSCPKTICRCELSAEAPAAEAATEFAAAAPSGGGLADTTADEEAPEVQDEVQDGEESEASAAEALAKADAEAEADAQAEAEEAPVPAKPTPMRKAKRGGGRLGRVAHLGVARRGAGAPR